MKLIIGLGNYGEQYENTRHNLGFMVVEQFLKDFMPVNKTVWSDEKKLKSGIALLDWERTATTDGQDKQERVILAKPKTYMNNSGLAVHLIASFYKVTPSDIWIVHDDLDLPVGAMKIRLGGAAAGHHGVESIISHMDTDKFWRYRLGIGGMKHSARPMQERDGEDEMIGRRTFSGMEGYVLGTFSGGERREIKKTIKHGSDALQVALEKGIETAQNRFNTK